jgi:hypothetical protein
MKRWRLRKLGLHGSWELWLLDVGPVLVFDSFEEARQYLIRESTMVG